jgi:cytochrome c
MKAVLIVIGVLVASAASAQEPAELGRTLLEDHCASCHVIGKTGDSPRENAPPFRTLSRSFDLDKIQGQLERGLTAGHPDVPEFKFGEDDARVVAAYLRSIQE